MRGHLSCPGQPGTEFGNVPVTPSPIGSLLDIAVSDTGPGLPPGKAEQIFDAFFTTKAQGSGMGLAINRSIVESHGVRIWEGAEAVHGATIYFTLPRASVEAEMPTVAT